MAIQASYSFALDREKGAWELLLSTPLPTSEMVRGQWMALQRLFFWPVVAIVLLDALLVNWGLAREHQDQGYWTLFFVGNAVMFLADLTALGWVGIWMGVNSKSAARAAAATIARVLLLPWAPLVLLWVVTIFVALVSGAVWDRWFDVLLGLWLCLGLTCDVILGLRAWRGLSRDLRTAAPSPRESRVASSRFEVRGSMFKV
jgi:hypothetical protein